MENKHLLIPDYHGNQTVSKIAFMVNVSWGNEFIPELLSLLKTYNVHLTFFLEGRWVHSFPELARSIHTAGHEIANHAYSHYDMTLISEDLIREEILKTNEAISDILGVTPRLFSPPYGHYDQRMMKVAVSENMQTILWSLDTIDWKIKQPDVIIQSITSRVTNGSIILMHPTQPSLSALPAILNDASGKGLTVTTISDLLSHL
ncbi:putative sporulation protein (polysaccharide deacetylase family) [Bacillus ectoiniformans]|uniref:polysaccharide deacetylase family protein n=1 Tax=Bacillus ectoiniformans TaxID=1494429 RepID=UPI00195D8638|nr:polysaccharide deacetylase family protein [Bacillus ectoiniformans]MBM7647428.1 putative sporulation protein (polysaccharide deacetylase family) [Bacillus ectoiniformans]